MKRLFAASRVAQLITVVALAVFTAAVSMGQTASAKKSYTFHGKVEAIDVNAKSLKTSALARIFPPLLSRNDPGVLN